MKLFGVSKPHVLKSQKGLKLNLGCSSVRVPGLINIDVRKIDLVDYAMDLSRLDLTPGSCEVLFSNAFFEHLPRQALLAHLRDAKKCLDLEKGVLCYVGIPDFSALVDLYLRHKDDQGPGKFDAFDIYYYLMGNPEGRPECYFEQLHKSVFDPSETNRLLSTAGFEHYLIFKHGGPHDKYPLNLGFFASLNPTNLFERANVFLKQFEERFITPGSVQFVDIPNKPKENWKGAKEGFKLTQLHPSFTRSKKPFNLLPWGESGMSVVGEGFSSDSVLYWNETPLVTTVASENLLTASIPPFLLEIPEEVELNLRSPSKGLKSNTLLFQVSD